MPWLFYTEDAEQVLTETTIQTTFRTNMSSEVCRHLLVIEIDHVLTWPCNSMLKIILIFSLNFLTAKHVKYLRGRIQHDRTFQRNFSSPRRKTSGTSSESLWKSRPKSLNFYINVFTNSYLHDFLYFPLCLSFALILPRSWMLHTSLGRHTQVR